MPVSSLSVVLLPEPLRPIMPTDSPLAMSNETLRSAQNSRARSSLAALPDVNRRTSAGIRSRSESCFSPRRNLFETSWNWIAASAMLGALRAHRFRLAADQPAQQHSDSGGQHRVA